MTDKPKRVTPRMRQVLQWIADGLGAHHNCHGQSEHGGRACTLLALMQRGLVGWDDYEITEAGRAVLAERIENGQKIIANAGKE